jgi:hypothetical protein
MVYHLALLHCPAIEFTAQLPKWGADEEEDCSIIAQRCGQLLGTCHQIHTEATCHLYSCNEFLFSQGRRLSVNLIRQTHPNHLLKSVAPTYHSLVRSAHIEVIYSEFYDDILVNHKGKATRTRRPRPLLLFQDLWRIILQQSRDAQLFFLHLQRLQIILVETDRLWGTVQSDDMPSEELRKWLYPPVESEEIAETLRTWATEEGMDTPWQLTIQWVPYEDLIDDSEMEEMLSLLYGAVVLAKPVQPES